MKKYIKIGVCILFAVFLCLTTGVIASASGYISSEDKANIEQLLIDTPLGNGNCMNIDGQGMAVVTFESVQSIMSSTRNKDGTVSEEPLSEYLPEDFYAISFNYEIMKLPDDTRRVLLDSIKYAFMSTKANGITDTAKQIFFNELREGYGDDIEYIQNEIIDGVQPNMFLAYELYYPFRGVVGTLLGCICAIILVALIMSTVLDIMYIQVPEFRERSFSATSRSGGGRFSFISNRSKIDRPWFISYEAAYASKESLESNGAKNALVLYFKHRILSYIILVVCVVYLTMGLYMRLVNGIWDTAPAIFDTATWK